MPDAARAAGCDYVPMLADVCSVVSNVEMQHPDPSDELRLRALLFHLARDAFIVLQAYPGR